MPALNLICGRAGTGKTTYCIKNIAKSLNDNEDRKLMFLVPEQFTVQAEKILLNQPETGGSIIRADVLNFKRMAHRVVSQYFNDVYIIDMPGRRMILYKAIEECKKELKLYKGALDHFGLLNKILMLLDEMGRYNFTTEKIEEIINELPGELPIKQKLTEISVIYSGYERILHQKYMDDKDILDILKDKIKDHDEYDGMKVWIDGFFGFTVQEYGIISEILGKAEEVNITLCCDDPDNRQYDQTDFLYSVYKTYDNLINISRKNNIQVRRTLLDENNENTRHSNNEPMRHFEREYESYPVKPYLKPADSIGIYAARDIYSEVEYAACRITELCRDRGYRYRDIAVVAKNIESYAPACKDIFEINDIPFFIDTKKDITGHPLAKLILSAMDIITENFSYKSVFTYLKSGLLYYSQEIVDLIENRVLEKNIYSYKRWTDDSCWVFGDEELNERINNERKEILRPILRFKENMSHTQTVRGQAEALYNFLNDADIPQLIENREDEEYIKIWNGLINILDKMVEALGHEHTPPQRFSDIFKAGLEDCQIGEIPDTADSIQIGSLERTKNTGVRALFLLGVNEGVIPGGVSDEGLITDSERHLLKEYKITLAADSHDQAYLEEFHIYEALMTPSEYLNLSYMAKDSAGKAKRPSRIIDRLKKMFPQIEVRDNILEEEIYIRPLGNITTKEYVYAQYVKHMGFSAGNEVWDQVGKYFSEDEKYIERINKTVSYKNLKSEDTFINENTALNLFGENIITSVSRVERYNMCPYSFFMEYGIRAKEREIPDYNVKEAGTFVHEVLERIGGNMKNISVEEIVDKILEDSKLFALKDTKRAVFLARRTGNTVKRVLETISHQIDSGKFKPYEFEGECNMEISLHNGRKARLTGKIDRIDMFKDGESTYFRVIDYKTGTRKFDYADVYNGTSIQLLAYLDSIVKNNPGVIPAGSLYFIIKDPYMKLDQPCSEDEIRIRKIKENKFNGVVLADTEILRAMDENIKNTSQIIPAGVKKDGSFAKNSWIVTEEQFGKLFEHVEDTISDTISNYTKGRIFPKPVRKNDDKAACDYCKYSGICGFDSRCGDKYSETPKIDKDNIWEALKNDN